MKGFIVLFLCLLPFSSFSQSIIRGGEITYKGLDSSRYEVTAAIYLECSTGYSSFTPQLTCSTNTHVITADTFWLASSMDITGLGKNCGIKTKCEDSTQQYGIEMRVYKAIFNHDTFGGCQMRFFFEGNSRSGSITTGCANTAFQLRAALDHCALKGLTNITYADPAPALTLCHNQDIIMNFSIADTSAGDSVSYHCVGALTTSGFSCIGGSWTPCRPLTFFGFPSQSLSWPAGFHVDLVTGDVMFRPTVVNQIAVIVIEARIWRTINGNPTMVATTSRELVPAIISCAGNKMPKFTGSFTKQACAGKQTCFDIITYDDDSSDTVDITLMTTIPGATFTHNNDTAKHASGTVCWTPDSTRVSNIPYTFTVKAMDNACPFPGRTTRTYSIFVRSDVSGSRTITPMGCGTYGLELKPDQNYPLYSGRWEILDTGGNTVHYHPGLTDTVKLQPGSYIFKSAIYSPTPCGDYFTDTVVVPYYFNVQLYSDTLHCFKDSFSVRASLSDTGTYDFSWEVRGPTDTLFSSGPADSIFVKAGGLHHILVRATDPTGCYNEHDIFVKSDAGRINPLLNAEFCAGSSVKIGKDTLIGPGRVSWSTWDTVPQITVSNPGLYIVNWSYPMGCFSSDSITVVRNSQPQLLLPPGWVACENKPVSISGMITNNITIASWEWEVDGVPVANDTSVYSFTAANDTKIKARAITDKGCSSTDSLEITVDKILLQYPWTVNYTCPGAQVQVGPVNAPSGNTYTWGSGQTGPNVYVNTQGYHVLTTTTVHGCIRKDSQQVVWFSVPVINTSADSLVCRGDSLLFHTNVTGVGPFTYQWSTGSNLPSAYVRPGRIDLVVTDVNTCTTKLERQFHEAPEPVQAFTDTAACKGSILPAFPGNDSSLVYLYLRSDSTRLLFFEVEESDTIKLDMATRLGCQVSFTYRIKADTIPHADFAFKILPNQVVFYPLDTLSGISYRYEFHDGTFSKGMSAYKTYLNNGAYPVTLIVTDDSTGCSGSVTHTVTLPNGVSEPEDTAPAVYPNPFENELTVGLAEPAALQLSLADVSGRIMWQAGSESSTEHSFSMKELPAGIYILTVKNGAGVYNYRLIKLR